MIIAPVAARAVLPHSDMPHTDYRQQSHGSYSNMGQQQGQPITQQYPPNHSGAQPGCYQQNQTSAINSYYAPYTPGTSLIPIGAPPTGEPQLPEWGAVPPAEDFDDKMITETMDTAIRHSFIRRVYGLVSFQVLVTFALALMFVLWDDANYWIIVNWWAALTASLVAMFAVIVLSCSPGLARQHPLNLVILTFISLCFGIVLGYASAAVGSFGFALAAGITAVVSISLTLFALQTRWDFTGLGVYLFVSFIVLIVMGIVMIFIRNAIAHIVFASIGALLCGIYMVYDTQQIVGGKHRKHQYSIDDYVFAALSLYMDIINMFLFILSIIGYSSEV